jgi:hypothetical protein
MFKTRLMKLASKFLCFTALLGFPNLAQAQNLEVEVTSFSQAQAFQKFSKNLVALLPYKMRQALPPVVRINLVKAPEATTLPVCVNNMNGIKIVDSSATLASTSDAILLSRIHNGETLTFDLDVTLFAEIMKGPQNSQQIDCGHRLGYRFAQAAILHQLAIWYDNVVRADEEEIRRVDPANEPMQAYFIHLTHGVSDRSQFRAIINFGIDESFQHPIQPSFDRRERESAAEAFATYFEYYVLDSSFPCRREALDLYFQKTLGASSSSIGRCSSKHTLSNKVNTFDLSFDRVYEIDYLYAGPGDDLSSVQGHSLFRIVICPKGMAKGPECKKWMKEDLVVDYRADTLGKPASNWTGFWGGYESSLEAISLARIQQFYQDEENRELYSVPLHLNAFQQRIFLARVLEEYEFYRGNYYFLSNNCAIEAQRLVRSVTNEFEFKSWIFQDPRMSPNGLWNLLNESGLGDTSVFTDVRSATEAGHYFPAMRPGRTPKFIREK